VGKKNLLLTTDYAPGTTMVGGRYHRTEAQKR
jgi:hypothetical protein